MGFPDLDLSFLFGPFRFLFSLDFPFFGGGIFPICPFPLSRPMKAPTRNIPENVRGPFLKKNEKPSLSKPPGLETPPGLLT